MTDYLTVIEIVAIHKLMIDRYGGTHGIRDAGAIEAACYRPQSGYYADTVAEAAALMESLAMSHPFLDGNKRVAFAAAEAFLRINGHKMRVEQMQAFRTVMRLFDTQKFEVKELEKMLRGWVEEA